MADMTQATHLSADKEAGRPASAEGYAFPAGAADLPCRPRSPPPNRCRFSTVKNLLFMAER